MLTMNDEQKELAGSYGMSFVCGKILKLANMASYTYRFTAAGINSQEKYLGKLVSAKVITKEIKETNKGTFVWYSPAAITRQFCELSVRMHKEKMDKHE